MSTESFAALRKHAGSELAALAEDHYKHEYWHLSTVVVYTRPHPQLTYLKLPQHTYIIHIVR